jgi:Icc-related predicted phosphoesterase
VLTRAALRRAAGWLLVLVVALGSAGAALSAWGSAPRNIGPLETTLGIVPSLAGGGVTVGVPPLGRLRMATHTGPFEVRAAVTGVRPGRARALIASRNPGRDITEQVADDSQDALAAAAARGVLVALFASGVTCAVVFRRRRAVLGGTAAVTAVMLVSGAVAGATLRTQALTEPTFEGLLARAPTLIGRVQSFDAYSQRVADLTGNVARVYGDLATLPGSPADDSTRVLWVSDVHNNVGSFAVMRQLARQFDVAAIIDTGDLADLGSTFENRLLTPIGTFGIPYVYVRGNHDSRSVTQAFVAAQPDAVVLDDGSQVVVRGVRFAGIGDPTFTPNKQVGVQVTRNDERLLRAGERLADSVEASEQPVHVALVHQPKMAEPLMGRVPLVLDGHVHERRSRVDKGTLELTQGSSGGAGLRTLDGDSALPLQMSVLHFDDDGTLLAVDDITIGGLGERSVTVERRTPQSYGKEPADTEPPDPTAPPSPAGPPGATGPPGPTAPAGGPAPSPLRSAVPG